MRRTPLIDKIEQLGLQHSFQLPARMPVFRPFKQAREFTRSLKLKGQKEWVKYCKSGKRPSDIPSTPERTYKNKGWVSMGDWLGTGNERFKEFKFFKQAREFVRLLELKNWKEWWGYCKSGKRPNDIPTAPERVYKDKGWVNYGDWLGTGNVANKDRTYRPFEQAREFVRSLKLKTEREWRTYCKSGKRLDDIPSNPNEVYKDKGWIGIKDWLGTSLKPFKEAREFARSLGLKTTAEWKAYSESGKKPSDIPARPDRIYKDKGWVGIKDWLGTEKT